MPTKAVYGLGRLGVDTDTDPLTLDDQACRKMQNAQHTVGVLSSRPGFASWNGLAAAGAIIGGIGVPLGNRSTGGTRFLFIGRGPL